MALALGGAAAAVFGAEKALGSKRDRLAMLRWLRPGRDLRDIYIPTLRRCLDWVDRRLGDYDRPNRWLSAKVGLTPLPFWTAWSFDRLAVLALAYPLLGVFASWLWGADAGAALGLEPGEDGLHRLMAGAGFSTLKLGAGLDS